VLDNFVEIKNLIKIKPGINLEGHYFFCLLPPVNLVLGLVLASSGSGPLPIVVAEDRTLALPTKVSVNHH
jgi:hypothetical protein